MNACVKWIKSWFRKDPPVWQVTRQEPDFAWTCVYVTSKNRITGEEKTEVTYPFSWNQPGAL